MNKIVNTSEAPAPIGPYSQAVWAGNLLLISGQIAIEPETQQLVQTSLEAETHQVMKNLHAILKAAGLGFANVAKCSIFLDNMEDFSTINEIYGQYFKENPPARETVEVSRLPKGVRVEISAMAVKA